jgi:hypothetical protein
MYSTACLVFCEANYLELKVGQGVKLLLYLISSRCSSKILFVLLSERII